MLYQFHENSKKKKLSSRWYKVTADGWMEGLTCSPPNVFSLTFRTERLRGSRRTSEILLHKCTVLCALSQWMELQLSNTSKPTGNGMCDHSSFAHWSSVDLSNYLYVYVIYHLSIYLISTINLSYLLTYLPPAIKLSCISTTNQSILSTTNQSTYLPIHPSIYLPILSTILYVYWWKGVEI
jgi:hypothetical protein